MTTSSQRSFRAQPPPADWTDLATLASADLGTDTYLVLGCCNIGVGSTGRFFRTEIRGADNASSIATLGVQQAEGEDTSEQRVSGFAVRHHATTATDVIIRAQEEAANGNMTDEGSYLIALDESLFADTIEYDYIAALTSAISSEVTVASVGPYTPSVNGNHLIFGRVSSLDADGAEIQLHLEDGTTETRTGDSGPTHDQGWDNIKDQEYAATMQRISISSQKTYNLRAAGGSWEAKERWLIVVNLNKPSVGPAEKYRQTRVVEGLVTADRRSS